MTTVPEPEEPEPDELAFTRAPAAPTGFLATMSQNQILPGQEFEVSWVLPSADRRAGLRVEVWLEDHYLGGTGEIPGTIRLTRPEQPGVAARLYGLGYHDLEVRLTDSLTGGSVGVRVLQLVVEPPDLAAAWSWVRPTYEPAWKQDYTVGGELINPGLATLRVVETSMREIDLGKSREVIGERLLAAPPPMAPAPAGSKLRVEAQPKPKDWRYYGPTAGPFGRLSKQYGYRLDLEIDDEFGNRYTVENLVRTVTVTVSREKRRWARVANALDAAGAGLMAAAAVAGAHIVQLGAAAIGLTKGKTLDKVTGASGARREADDPLTPDFDYAETVILTAPPVLQGFDDPGLDQLAAALRNIDYAILALSALHTAESRWLGARMRDDSPAAARQRDSYFSLLEELRRLEELLRSDQEDLSDSQILTRAQLDDTLRTWQREGIPADAVEAWRDDLEPDEIVRVASAILGYGSELIPAAGVGRLVRVATSEVLRIVEDVVEGQPRALVLAR
jgi:hypothetical protein